MLLFRARVSAVAISFGCTCRKAEWRQMCTEPRPKAAAMLTIERILCPIDFSDYSRHAIDRALSLAGSYSGTITALHVVTQVVTPRPPDLPVLYPPIVITPEDLEQFRAHTREFVAEQSEGVPVDVIVVTGHVASEIVQFAAELPADIIVIGTHGRSVQAADAGISDPTDRSTGALPRADRASSAGS